MKEFLADYFITPEGDVISQKGSIPRLLKPKVDKDGYLEVCLCLTPKIRKTLKVHRIVAEAYLDNLGKLPVVNHKNGCKSDNNVINLEWCTQSDNLKHARDLELRKYKVSADIADDVRNAKGSYKLIAKMFGISATQVGRIKRGECWK